MISGTKTSWRPVTSSATQGTTVDPILFNVIINDPDDVAECRPKNMLMFQNWEEWLTCQRIVLPPRGDFVLRMSG